VVVARAQATLGDRALEIAKAQVRPPQRLGNVLEEEGRRPVAAAAVRPETRAQRMIAQGDVPNRVEQDRS
jgi:hypothetical protein